MTRFVFLAILIAIEVTFLSCEDVQEKPMTEEEYQVFLKRMEEIQKTKDRLKRAISEHDSLLLHAAVKEMKIMDKIICTQRFREGKRLEDCVKKKTWCYYANPNEHLDYISFYSKVLLKHLELDETIDSLRYKLHSLGVSTRFLITQVSNEYCFLKNSK